MNIIQFVISILLFSILGFGLGFILNMLLKTTWLPVVLGLSFLFGYLLYMHIVPGIFDAIILAFGILGTVMSSWTIQLLRKKGYQMF